MLPLLQGVRILDLTKLFTLATSRLADLGADVVKIEEPPEGDYLRGLPPLLPAVGTSLAYLMLNRNKRSVGLDLKQAEGRRIFLELVATADAVVELGIPGAIDRLGLGYADLKTMKPDLIYCAISGYGQNGPFCALPSHGMNIDAAAAGIGIEYGPDGRPEVAGYTMIGRGIELGALHAALAVTAAIVQRSRTGQGQYIDASCWDAAVASSQGFQAALNLGSSAEAIGAAGSGGLGAKYNVYGTADAKVIFICPLEKRLWDRFCAVVNRPEWTDRGDWAERMDFGAGDDVLRADIEAALRTRTLSEWMDLFSAAGVPASPVLTADELVSQPHTVTREMIVNSSDPRYDGVQFVRPPLRLPDSAYSIAIPPPVFGEHTDEVLAELGYSQADRDRLISKRIAFSAQKTNPVSS